MRAFFVAFLFVIALVSLGCETPELPSNETGGKRSPNVQGLGKEEPLAVDTEAIKSDIKTLFRAPEEGNIDAMVDLAHPFYTEMLGGRAKAMESMKEVVKVLKENNAKVVSIDFPGEFEVVGIRKQYIIIPFRIVILAKGIESKASGSYIGERFTNGKWRYIDASKIDRLEKATKRKILPGFPEDYQFKPAGQEHKILSAVSEENQSKEE